VSMIKNRKTTMEERIEIVRYCIEHGNEYKIAAEWFQVSYAQVYQWVKKYQSNGEEGLRDRRGMRKNEEKLSDIERLQRKIKQLERQLELKERETEVLKKVQEIERRRSSPEAGDKRNTKPSNN
jgi:transposase